jgi:hypothetical protein
LFTLLQPQHNVVLKYRKVHHRGEFNPQLPPPASGHPVKGRRRFHFRSSDFSWRSSKRPAISAWNLETPYACATSVPLIACGWHSGGSNFDPPGTPDIVCLRWIMTWARFRDVAASQAMLWDFLSKKKKKKL